MRERNERERNRTWRERGNWRERGLEDRDAYGEFPGQFGDREGSYGSGGRHGDYGGGRHGSWGDPHEYEERWQRRSSAGHGREPASRWEQGSYGRGPEGERHPTRDRWEAAENPEGDYQGPGNYEQRPGYGRGGAGYGYGAGAYGRQGAEPFNQRGGSPSGVGYGGGHHQEPSAERAGGGFRGRGPRGYTRSDERIREEVCERLADEDIDVSDVEVSVTKGEVTLSGTVSERWIKREAESLAESISGVKDVNNQIRVKRRTEEEGEMPATTMGTKGAERKGQNEERAH